MFCSKNAEPSNNLHLHHGGRFPSIHRIKISCQLDPSITITYAIYSLHIYQCMMNTQGETLPLAQRRYQEWLQSKQVHSSDLVSTTNDTNLVVAGWGCVAKSDIKEGTVLFSIPRAACFGAQLSSYSCSVDDDPTTRDDQMDMAISILRCQKQDNDGSNNIKAEQQEDWSPFLNILTHPPCGLPWTWPSQFRQTLLRGTELELVVENKVERIRIEYEQVAKQQQDLSITFQEYINACAIVSR